MIYGRIKNKEWLQALLQEDRVQSMTTGIIRGLFGTVGIYVRAAYEVSYSRPLTAAIGPWIIRGLLSLLDNYFNSEFVAEANFFNESRVEYDDRKILLFLDLDQMLLDSGSSPVGGPYYFNGSLQQNDATPWQTMLNELKKMCQAQGVELIVQICTAKSHSLSDDTVDAVIRFLGAPVNGVSHLAERNADGTFLCNPNPAAYHLISHQTNADGTHKAELVRSNSNKRIDHDRRIPAIHSVRHYADSNKKYAHIKGSTKGRAMAWVIDRNRLNIDPRNVILVDDSIELHREDFFNDWGNADIEKFKGVDASSLLINRGFNKGYCDIAGKQDSVETAERKRRARQEALIGKGGIFDRIRQVVADRLSEIVSERAAQTSNGFGSNEAFFSVLDGADHPEASSNHFTSAP